MIYAPAKVVQEKRAALRREGSIVYSMLVCECGASKKFTAPFDPSDQSVTRLNKPIDKLAHDIRDSGWRECGRIEHDWCPECRLRRRAASMMRPRMTVTTTPRKNKFLRDFMNDAVAEFESSLV